MITKWATSIANKLAELSGEDVSADQLEIYIYGLECFLNTFITIVLLFAQKTPLCVSNRVSATH